MKKENSAVKEIKISVNQLAIGMYVCRLDKDWIDSPFLFQGFLIENDGMIQALKHECQHVYIDGAKGLSINIDNAAKDKKSGFSLKGLFGKKEASRDQPSSRKHTYKLKDIVERKIVAENITPPPKLATFDQELTTAKQAYANTDQLIAEFTSKVKEGSAIDMLVAQKTVHDYMSSILRSPDAMLLITRLKKKHQAAWQHSMNVCVLALNLGRYLNLDDNELTTLGLCGLFHDIGKMRISEEMLAESDDDQEIKRLHTTFGRDILQHTHNGALGEIVAEVAFCHHEKLNGTGFPRGLSGDKISPYTRMITIVDTYDALTTEKPGRKPLTHYDAITVLLKQAGKELDETLVNRFNQCIGTYPVGCVVELNTGELGMVVEGNENQKLRPKVMLLTTPDKKICPKKVIDLADACFSEGDTFCSVKGIILPEKYGLRL